MDNLKVIGVDKISETVVMSCGCSISAIIRRKNSKNSIPIDVWNNHKYCADCGKEWQLKDRTLMTIKCKYTTKGFFKKIKDKSETYIGLVTFKDDKVVNLHVTGTYFGFHPPSQEEKDEIMVAYIDFLKEKGEL